MKAINLHDDYSFELPSKKHVKSLFNRLQEEKEYLSEWSHFIDQCSSLKVTQQIIEENKRQFDRLMVDYRERLHPGFQCIIHLDDEVVGMVGFQGIHMVNRIASMGYWVSQNHSGRGLVTTATQKLIEYGREVLDINRFEIQCRVDNEKSQAIPQRLSFQKEGRLRAYEFDQTKGEFVDHFLYSLLADEI